MYAIPRQIGQKYGHQGAPSNHPQNAGQFMNPELKENSNDNNNNNNGMIDDDDDDDEPHIPRVTEFHKGHQLDIKITDEHQETFWTTGIICRIQENKVCGLSLSDNTSRIRNKYM